MLQYQVVRLHERTPNGGRPALVTSRALSWLESKPRYFKELDPPTPKNGDALMIHPTPLNTGLPAFRVA